MSQAQSRPVAAANNRIRAASSGNSRSGVVNRWSRCPGFAAGSAGKVRSRRWAAQGHRLAEPGRSGRVLRPQSALSQPGGDGGERTPADADLGSGFWEGGRPERKGCFGLKRLRGRRKPHQNCDSSWRRSDSSAVRAAWRAFCCSPSALRSPSARKRSAARLAKARSWRRCSRCCST